MSSTCGTGMFGNRDNGSCPKEKPYCNDFGFCQEGNLVNYTGKNKKFNSKYYLILYSVITVVVLIVLFILFKKFKSN